MGEKLDLGWIKVNFGQILGKLSERVILSCFWQFPAISVTFLHDHPERWT